MSHLNRRRFLQTAGAVTGAHILSGGCSTAPSRIASVDGASTRPNILFMFPDQHRYDWLGTTPGIPVRTPNLDALGQRGVRFERAVCPSPVCAPSRACLASGMEYDRCGVPSNGTDYPLDQETFYTLLRDSGYHVAGCGKFDLHKPSETWGLDGKHLLHEWGYSDGIDNAGKYDAVRSGAKKPKDPYMAFLYKRGLAEVHIRDLRERRGFRDTYPTALPDDAYCDNWIAENGLQLMEKFPENKPWFLMVNFTGPHNPMDITEHMHAWYGGVNFPQPNRNTQFDEDTHVKIRQNYSAMVENIDWWVGYYVNELKRRGELDNTLIVFSSDHGEMLGDHNMWAKTKPYQPSAGVPLLFAGPGVAQGRVNRSAATTLDCTATFLEYAGVRVPKSMDSRSLRPVLTGSAESNRYAVRSGLGKWRLAFDGRYKLIRGFPQEGETLLFDLHNDPLENENLAEGKPAEVARLTEWL